jgi:hypothetical protein
MGPDHHSDGLWWQTPKGVSEILFRPNKIVDFANGLDSKIGWIIDNAIVDGSQPNPMMLIGSNLSTTTNRANPRWIAHNGLVKNRVNKHMFTLYIEKFALITMRGNRSLMVVGNPKE